MIKIIKRIVFSLGFMYAFNLIFQPLAINIPINLYSLALFYFLGIPSVFYFVIIKLLI